MIKKKTNCYWSENQLSHQKISSWTWWNHEIVQAKAQIRHSGRIIEQKVTFLGKEKLDLYGKLMKHFVLIFLQVTKA